MPRKSKAQSEAERTVASIARMLGWRNVPPRATLEADIRALKARAERAPEPDYSRSFFGDENNG